MIGSFTTAKNRESVLMKSPTPLGKQVHNSNLIGLRYENQLKVVNTASPSKRLKQALYTQSAFKAKEVQSPDK